MFLRVVCDAQIGKNRDIRESYMQLDSRGELRMTFDKDIDWTKPVFMMLIPTEEELGG